MPHLLIHETGVHFMDTFRYLAGDIVECSAEIRRLNNVIEGEDAGTLSFRFSSGARAVWDANRYNESLSENFRYTFGELLVEADGGSLWLNCDGTLTVKRLGQPAHRHDYLRRTQVLAAIVFWRCSSIFWTSLDGRANCETSASEYLKTLGVVEACYESSKRNRPVALSQSSAVRRRIIDLSLPVTSTMRGVEILPCKTLDSDGWNATTLSLYSHAGTHMDAPRHFLADGDTLDQQDLSVCCGPARVVNLAPAKPRHLITVADVVSAIGEVYPGDRLLFRTDWHQRLGTPEYRDELPRISIELAHWLVEQQGGHDWCRATLGG